MAFVVLYRLFALSFYFPVFIEFLRFFSLKKKVCINYKRQKVSTVTNNDKKFTTVFLSCFDWRRRLWTIKNTWPKIEIEINFAYCEIISVKPRQCMGVWLGWVRRPLGPIQWYVFQPFSKHFRPNVILWFVFVPCPLSYWTVGNSVFFVWNSTWFCFSSQSLTIIKWRLFSIMLIVKQG